MFQFNNLSMNMNCNPLMMLAQQGFGSCGLGGGSFMGNSVFGMGGNVFTNCFGQVDYDAMAGYGITTSLLNIGSYIYSEHKAQQEPKVDHKQELTGVNSDIAEELAKFPEGFNSEFTYKNCTIENTTEYTTWKNLNEKCTQNQTTVDNYNATSTEATIKNYEELKAKLTTTVDEQEKANINNQLSQGKSAYDAAVKAQNEYNAAVKALETDKPNLAKAKEAKDAKETELNAAKENLEELLAKKQEYQNEINNEILDDADGTKLTRISSEKFNEKFQTEEDGSLKFAENVKFTKRDLSRAILNYSTAQSEEDKAKAKNQFKMVYSWLNNNDSDELKGMGQAYKVIMEA